MKCEYIGSMSHEGCNEEALPGDRFCHQHRVQGRNNELTRKLQIGCLVLGLLLIGGCGVFCAVAIIGT
jgi:hypothetical protein